MTPPGGETGGTRAELTTELMLWARQDRRGYGAEHGWLIDPERKVVESYRPGREPKVVEGANAVYGEGLVSGFVLELLRLWA